MFRALQTTICSHPVLNVAGADPGVERVNGAPLGTHQIKVVCQVALGQHPYLESFVPIIRHPMEAVSATIFTSQILCRRTWRHCRGCATPPSALW